MLCSRTEQMSDSRVAYRGCASRGSNAGSIKKFRHCPHTQVKLLKGRMRPGVTGRGPPHPSQLNLFLLSISVFLHWFVRKKVNIVIAAISWYLSNRAVCWVMSYVCGYCDSCRAVNNIFYFIFGIFNSSNLFRHALHPIHQTNMNCHGNITCYNNEMLIG